jgi:hypothetical protein
MGLFTTVVTQRRSEFTKVNFLPILPCSFASVRLLRSGLLVPILLLGNLVSGGIDRLITSPSFIPDGSEVSILS